MENSYSSLHAFFPLTTLRMILGMMMKMIMITTSSFWNIFSGGQCFNNTELMLSEWEDGPGVTMKSQCEYGHSPLLVSKTGFI